MGPGFQTDRQPRPGDGLCAIVGGGLAGFVSYATLLRGGIRPDDVTVFDEDPDPTAAWARRARSIRQRWMRSESDGHCGATSFPGLAVRATVRRRSLGPLLGSVTSGYNPTVDEFLEHVVELRRRLAWDERMRLARISSIVAVDGGFAVADQGTYRHVLLATGHPGLALPDELADDPRVVHAYEPHEYAPTVTVVGAGMAAATEWLNALAAGSTVVSVRRREPERRPLNLPRPYFSRRGLAAFHATPTPERAMLLRRLGAPSYPPGRRWDEPLARAAGDGRFRVEPRVNGSEQIVCATGFRRGYVHDPLLSDLVVRHELTTCDAWIVVANDCTVPSLTDGTRTLALAGVSAQWSFPAADTIIGAKYAARGFLRRVGACRTR